MLTIFLLCRLLYRVRPKRRPRKTTRTTTRIVVKSQMPVRQKTVEQMRRDADRAARAEMKRRQARDDLVHLEQMRRDMLAAYQTARIDGDSEKAIRKRISYDEQMRRIEKRIETASFDARH